MPKEIITTNALFDKEFGSVTKERETSASPGKNLMEL